MLYVTDAIFMVKQKDGRVCWRPEERVFGPIDGKNIEDAAIKFAVDCLSELTEYTEYYWARVYFIDRVKIKASFIKGDFFWGDGHEESIPLEINFTNKTAEVNGKHVDLKSRVERAIEKEMLRRREEALRFLYGDGWF